MPNTNSIVPRSNSDMRKLIFSGKLTLFSKNRLFQKHHVCPIDLGVFGHAEYEYHSPESELRHAKIDILGYRHIILQKSTFSERPCMPYRIRGFRACRIRIT